MRKNKTKASIVNMVVNSSLANPFSFGGRLAGVGRHSGTFIGNIARGGNFLIPREPNIKLVYIFLYKNKFR